MISRYGSGSSGVPSTLTRAGMQALVVADRVKVARRPQYPLPPLLLAHEGGLDPVDHAGVIHQVRDEARHMRQVHHRREGGARP